MAAVITTASQPVAVAGSAAPSNCVPTEGRLRGTVLHCVSDERAVEVDPDHFAAGGPEELADELADQPEADDRHPLAQPDIGLTDAVHRDAPQRREGGVLEAEAGRQPHAQVAGYAIDLRVHGAVAPAGHVVARHQIRYARADLEHDARGRIAEAGRVLQARARTARTVSPMPFWRAASRTFAT